MLVDWRRMGLPVLASTDALVIRQQKELTEVFTNLETANQYTVSNASGQALFHVAEQSDGAMAFLTRNFLQSKRPFTMSVLGMGSAGGLSLRRPWRWFFDTLEVRDQNGAALGTIQQRFSILSKRFTVHGADGSELAVLHGPLFRPWTFKILVGGQEVGKITKQWSGLLKEAFTDADTFGVQYGPAMDERLRTLAMAATFLIDFLYFEKSGTD